MTSPAEAVKPTVLPIGFSELLGVLGAVSTFLLAVFGHDWGVARAATDIAAAGPVVIPLAISYTRALKHRSYAMVKAAAITSAK